MLIARHLGIPLATLIDPHIKLFLPAATACKFKTRSGVQIEELFEVRTFAEIVARIAVKSMKERPAGVPGTDAVGIRRHILEQGARCVSLAALLDYCWSIGIPVLHVDVAFQPKKPDGVAVMVDGRPVILLCKKASYSAWLLFILAHELGHIALHHIDGNCMLVDEKVSEEMLSTDADEKTASNYAIKLLTGNSAYRITSERWPRADKLAEAAISYGEQHHIDPGHIALNLANTTSQMPGKNFYPLANAALCHIEPHADATALVRAKMEENLPWDNIPEESGEFIRRMTGADRCLVAAV